MHITIVVPFDSAERYVPIWAHDEAGIDFQRERKSEPERAARCTLAFAALELKTHLERTLPHATFAFAAQRPAQGSFIELHVDAQHDKPGGFTLALENDSVVITGHDRAGALYGAYELLRLQGWRWYAPGKAGEIVPPQAESLVLPERVREFAPSFDQGRGFDFEYASMDSAEMWLWMARNRLNVPGARPATAALVNKLGMSPKTGGHIFEAILDPNRPMPSGRTLWEEHPDWYGQPANGERRKESALQTQFCVSQPELVEFLAGEFLQRVMGQWRSAERVDVWGFDTWGNMCACADCRQLGNGADQMLFFLSRLRNYLDAARRDGRLDHDMRLVTCAYEGTATLAGPLHPIPRNLIAAGDMIVFYPINRCYAHDLADPNCPTNARYQAAMASWFAQQPALPFIAADYFNVSKYEDLPLLFTGRIRADLPAYHAQGARAVTYMHVPMVNWAMRTLTQALYAQLAWDVDTDVDAFLVEYFENWYGPYAEAMRQVYAQLEQAWRFIADWRAWSPDSILSQLLAWDGARPAQPLRSVGHLATPDETIFSGRACIALMEQSLASITMAQATERTRAAQLPPASNTNSTAVNPIQARILDQANQYELRLGEDRRLLRYGLHTIALMTEIVAYHDALYGDVAQAAEIALQQAQQLADELDSYYIPIGYEWPGPGLESKDALTRTQLRAVLARCRRTDFLTRPPIPGFDRT